MGLTVFDARKAIVSNGCLRNDFFSFGEYNFVAFVTNGKIYCDLKNFFNERFGIESMSYEDVANQMHDEVENYIRKTFTDCYVDTDVEEMGTAEAKYEFVFGKKRHMFNNISFTANPISSSDAIVLFLANQSEWAKEYVEKMLEEQEWSLKHIRRQVSIDRFKEQKLAEYKKTPSKDPSRPGALPVSGAAYVLSYSIADIAKVTHYSRIYDTDHSNDELFAIAYDATTKSYTYWYSDPATQAGWTEPANYHQMGADEHINASGECYVIFIDGKWDFKAAGTLDGDALRETVKGIDGNHQLKEDFVITDGATSCNFGKKFDVGTSMTDNSKREGLALKVSELQAEPATWRVVPMSTSALKRGEIAMSIAPDSAMYNASAIDLAKCSAPLDITENGWFLAAPTEVTKTGAAADAVTHDAAKALPLIVNAKIAGSNVNDAGCTPVVRVTYSIIPMFETGDTQTATAGGVGSNR